MIMQKPSDLLSVGFSPSLKIRVVHADVTDSARALEQSHLCGPTAGLTQAEALAGVALLGIDLEQPEETITLKLRVSGPIGGLLVEASRDGGLRGYTQIKVMNALDEKEEFESADALGERGEAQIIRSVPGRILAHGMVELSPVSIKDAVERYFSQSLQRRTAVQLTALAYGGFIDAARGVLFDCLPDGDTQAFERLRTRIEDGTVLEGLESPQSLDEFFRSLGIDDLKFDPPRALRFACRCSPERVEAMLGALPSDDLRQMAAKDEPARIFCHMCGKGYTIARETILAVLARREAGPLTP